MEGEPLKFFAGSDVQTFVVHSWGRGYILSALLTPSFAVYCTWANEIGEVAPFLGGGMKGTLSNITLSFIFIFCQRLFYEEDLKGTRNKCLAIDI